MSITLIYRYVELEELDSLERVDIILTMILNKSIITI